MMKQTVFVILEDQSYRADMCRLTAENGFSTCPYLSAEQFFEESSDAIGGCVLTDFERPGMDGFRFQQRMRVRGIHLPVVFLADGTTTDLAVQAMRAGAAAVIQKPVNRPDLVNTIRSCLESDERRCLQEKHQRDCEARLATLNPKEQEVLWRMLSGMPNKTIALELGVSLRTIESRRHNVFEKTKTQSISDLVILTFVASGRLDPFGLAPMPTEGAADLRVETSGLRPHLWRHLAQTSTRSMASIS